MKYLNLIPALYLYQGKAVDKDTKEIMGDGNPVSMAIDFDNNGADELLIFDMSSNDSEHEANIRTIDVYKRQIIFRRPRLSFLIFFRKSVGP